MSLVFPEKIHTDAAGNKRDTAPVPPADLTFGDLLGTSSFVSTAVGTADIVALTLAGQTGDYTSLKDLEITVAGFTGVGSSATIFGTVYDGTPTTTPLGSFVLGENGHFQNLLEGINCTSATTGNGISIHISAGATGVSVAATARKKFVNG